MSSVSLTKLFYGYIRSFKFREQVAEIGEELTARIEIVKCGLCFVASGRRECALSMRRCAFSLR